MGRVLVIDDDIDFLETVQTILTENHFEVEVTSKLDDIYRIILAFKPDIILLDINLEGADGRNICRGLKNHFKTKSIPVILCSGNTKIKDEYPAYLAENFIEKPFEYNHLIAELRNYCQPTTSEMS